LLHAFEVVKTFAQQYTAVQIEAQEAKCGTEAAPTAWMAPQHFSRSWQFYFKTNTGGGKKMIMRVKTPGLQM